MGVLLGLEVLDNLTTLVQRHLTIDDRAVNLVLGEVGLQQFDGVRERYEYQYLTSSFFDNFRDHVQAVRYIELDDFSIVRIDRTAAYLQQLVYLGRCIDRANLFTCRFDKHLVLKLVVVLTLLGGERRFAFSVRHFW